jgi:hypothetical protein
VKARTLDRQTDLVTCEYRSGAVSARVTVDGLPQAYRRWSNALEEREQNTAGWHTAAASQGQPVDGLGLGAYWVAAERTLSATDGVHLVTVVVRGTREPLAVATAAARVRLGPVRQPPGM